MAKKENNKTDVEVAICDHKQTASDGKIILYKPHDDVIIEHLSNIYKCGELDEASKCSILEHMGNDGKQKYITRYYNLDAILSVGYRVKWRTGSKYYC